MTEGLSHVKFPSQRPSNFCVSLELGSFDSSLTVFKPGEIKSTLLVDVKQKTDTELFFLSHKNKVEH